jgi:hypothetical protein
MNENGLTDAEAELLTALWTWRNALPTASGRPSAEEYRAAKMLAHHSAVLLRSLGVDDWMIPASPNLDKMGEAR